VNKLGFLPSLLALLALAAPAWGHEGHLHHASGEDLDSARPAALSGESIYNLDSTWINQDGEAVKLSSLRGAPTVIAMVYTSCQSACPLTMADLARIEKALPESRRKQARFAVFSFDSARDTPSTLKRFAEAHGLDLGHWALFHGNPGAVRKLAAVLGIRYQKDQRGDFNHSNVITLVNSGGTIQYQQVGLRQNPKEIVAALQRLLGASP
jgi:protein SCO1/2